LAGKDIFMKIAYYLRIALRHLFKNKIYTTVNAISLSLGMVAALILVNHILFERSFDKFHCHSRNIYRVTTEWNANVTPSDRRATTVAWSGPGIKDEFPEVLEYTRLAPIDNFTGFNTVRYGEISISEQKIYLADPGFLTMFSFCLVKGDPKTALNDPTSVIITKSIASKYFGDEDPIGKVLTIDTHGNLSENGFIVTGIINDPPANSHLSFNFLLSFNLIHPALHNGSTYWHWDYTYAYLLLHPRADPSDLEKKISRKRLEEFGQEMTYYKDKIDFKLQPLTEIHLSSPLKGEIEFNGDGKSLNFLFVVVIAIIVSSYITYTNLSTVLAVERKMEFGVRRIIGSNPREHCIQLFVEAALLNAVAAATALLLYFLLVPHVSEKLGMPWLMSAPTNITLELGMFSFLIVLTCILISLIYPAVTVSSSFKSLTPSDLSLTRGNAGKIFTTLQLFVCICASTAAYALYNQLMFVKNYDVGFDMEQVLTVQGYGFESKSSVEQFKAQVATLPFVSNVSSSSAAPGEEILQLSLRPAISRTDALPGALPIEVKLVSADSNYFSTLGIAIRAGRTFSSDVKGVVVNDLTAELLGFHAPADAVGHELRGVGPDPLKILGVADTYNQRSLKSSAEPMIFLHMRETDFSWNKKFHFIKLTGSSDNVGWESKVAQVNRLWSTSHPDKPFHYFFLDDHFNRQYHGFKTFVQQLSFSAGAVILINGIGLIGMIAYAAQRRAKEISIRKVCGASASAILVLFSKEFLARLVFATLLAAPVMIVLVHEWLESYVERIPLSPGLFLIPLALITTLMLAVVNIKALKAAAINPAVTLRS
jgi:putative ABC transport system permease protein